MGANQSTYINQELMQNGIKPGAAQQAADAKSAQDLQKLAYISIMDGISGFEQSRRDEKIGCYGATKGHKFVQNEVEYKRLLNAVNTGSSQSIPLEFQTRMLLESPVMLPMNRGMDLDAEDSIMAPALCPQLVTCCAPEDPRRVVGPEEQIVTLLGAANAMKTVEIKHYTRGCLCCTCTTLPNAEEVLFMARMEKLVEVEDIIDSSFSRSIFVDATQLNGGQLTAKAVNDCLRRSTASLIKDEDTLRLSVAKTLLEVNELKFGVMPELQKATIAEIEASCVQNYLNNTGEIQQLIKLASREFNVLTMTSRIKEAKKVLSNLSAGKSSKDIYGVCLLVSDNRMSRVMAKVVKSYFRLTRDPKTAACRFKVKEGELGWLDFKLQIYRISGLLIEIQVVPVRNYVADQVLNGHDVHNESVKRRGKLTSSVQDNQL